MQLEDLDLQGVAGRTQVGVKSVGSANEKLTVRRCRISKFYRGVEAAGLDLDVIDSRIFDNHSQGEGGGIYHWGLQGAILNIQAYPKGVRIFAIAGRRMPLLEVL